LTRRLAREMAHRPLAICTFGSGPSDRRVDGSIDVGRSAKTVRHEPGGTGASDLGSGYLDINKAYSTFVRTLEAGSFSAVAREMGVSQSAVSKIIASLEAGLGVQLFTRTTRKVNPTEEARLLYDDVRRLLNTLELLTSSAKARHSVALSGILRISVPVSFGRRWMTPVVTQFLLENPMVRMEIIATDDPIDMIEGGLDLSVRIGRLPSNTLIARLIGSIEYSLIASPEYLRRFGRPKSPLDLAGHNCIVDRSVNQWSFESELGHQSVELSAVLRVNDAEAIYHAAVSGLGIALVPDWTIQWPNADSEVVTLLESYYPVPQPVSIVYPQTKFLSQRASTFIDFVSAELKRA